MLINTSVYKTLLVLTTKKTNLRTICSSLRGISSSRKYSKEVKENVYKGKYDIIIAGGGMVGCALACALGKNPILSNLKILLLEGSPQRPFQLKQEYSNRVVALNPNTKELMNSLQVWKHIEDMRLQPVRHMQVWDACSDAIISFSSADIMDDDVAYIVENDVVLHAVNKELSEVNNVNIVYGAKIAGYELPKTIEMDMLPESIVKMENGDLYSCRLLVSLKPIGNECYTY